jgi:hypothetical protein
MIVFAIDPATHGCGCALFRNGALISANYARNSVKDGDVVHQCAGSALAAHDWLHSEANRLMLIDPLQLVVELPQVYARGANKTRGDPNKCVLPLAMVNAALAALLSDVEVHSYQPHAWKGGTSKPKRAYDGQGREVPYVIKERVKERLTPGELVEVEWTGSVERSWDVADAIGIALHHIGRFGRARTYARE